MSSTSSPMSWVEPLGAWVMLYGGDDTDGSAPAAPESTPSPRTAPFTCAGPTIRGALRARRSRGAWTEAFPVLRPTDTPAWLACSAKGVPAGCAEGDRVRPIDFFRARLTGIDCRAGTYTLDRGIFYSAGVIDVLTRAVTPARSGARAAEIVWVISTWNPYAVSS